MSPYNPDIHHRHSIRLKGYDYASEGMYFVTICTQNRECLFGEIKNDEMILNDAGRMVEKWYRKTHDKFPDIICHEMVIMPNHFHCIWENVGLHGASAVGADPRVRPVTNNVRLIDNDDGRIINENVHVMEGAHANEGGHAGPPLRMDDMDWGVPNIIVDKYGGNEGAHVGAPLQTDLGEHAGSPLSSVVQWFKTMSTNEYIRGVKQLGWPPFDRKLWQRNYYEHIIRDDISLQTIAYYIVNNAAQWRNDKFYQPTPSI